MRSLRRFAGAVLIVAGVTLAFASPAFAARGPVPNDPVVRGVHLAGMAETEALAAISRLVTAPVIPPFPAVANGKTFVFRPGGRVVVNARAMLDDCYRTHDTSTFEVPARYYIRRASIAEWVGRAASRVNRAPVSSTRVVKGGKLYLTRSSRGFTLGQASSTDAIARRLASALSGWPNTRPLVLAYKRPEPKVSEKTIGKTIVVDLSDRWLRLYNGPKLEKAYRCAIGQRSYPTPKGLWKVVGKVKMPTWRNPGSAWASDMPSYIGPGPSNPLGTRALYLNASGIRIHGTVKLSSIGTAASHGCVRLRNRDVEALYPLVPIGTPVYIVP